MTGTQQYKENSRWRWSLNTFKTSRSVNHEAVPFFNLSVYNKMFCKGLAGGVPLQIMSQISLKGPLIFNLQLAR